MSDRPKSSNNLFQLSTFDPATGEILAVVETPKGSRNKYSYDERWSAFRLGGVLSEGMSFPYDFGFIPSTLGEDGDPLDVLILLDVPVMAGCLLTVRLLGAIEAEQQERDGEWMRNDRRGDARAYPRAHQVDRGSPALPAA